MSTLPEAQNDKIVEVKGTSEHHAVEAPCSKQSQVEQVVWGAVQLPFEYLQRWRPLIHSRQPV